VSSLCLVQPEPAPAQDYEVKAEEEPAELMHVPEPKKRVLHFFKGGSKKKREPQIQIDPNSGKKILHKHKAVNAGFKINKPADW
jgi:hypothetical protein